MRLTDEQRMLRDVARDFARTRLTPFAAERDREARFPAEAVAELGKLGFMGMLVPQAYGGAGADHIGYALVMEEIAAGEGAVSTILSEQNSVGCMPVLQYGSEEQKRQFLVPMAKGEMLACFCLTEPQAGSDAAAIKTRARRHGNRWVLSGTKQFISSGAHAQIAIVFAVTDPERGKRGISAFVVPTDAPGFRIARVEHKLGQRASDIAARFRRRRAHPRSDARRRGRGLSHRALEPRRRPHRHRGAIGWHGARRLRRRTGLCARTRSVRQADYRAPGGGVPARRHGDADRRGARTRAGRRSAARCRRALHQGGVDGEAVRLGDGRARPSDAIQIHGGYGYVADFPVERIYRDVRVCQIYEGTSDVQRLVIAREIAKD